MPHIKGMRNKTYPIPPHNQALLDEIREAGLKIIDISNAVGARSYSTFTTYLSGYRQFSNPKDWEKFQKKVRSAIISLLKKKCAA